ncbi:hypothetical protein [Sphingobium sp. CCH11-B1]|uniref:hypothetical protein n=1 Tax=Sphingobium sp. CCH11-B1 TaxID=1768781 RepID=UPI000833D4E7|nr:hypothetical protein [Sphingobium sp. CCH11-B1]
MAAVLIITSVLGLLAGLIAIFPIFLGVITYRYAKRAVLRALVAVQANRKLIGRRAFVLAAGPFLVPMSVIANAAVAFYREARDCARDNWRGVKRYWSAAYA